MIYVSKTKRQFQNGTAINIQTVIVVVNTVSGNHIDVVFSRKNKKARSCKTGLFLNAIRLEW